MAGLSPLVVQGVKQVLNRQIERSIAENMAESMHSRDGAIEARGLVKRYEEKDRLLDYFYSNGVFPATSSA